MLLILFLNQAISQEIIDFRDFKKEVKYCNKQYNLMSSRDVGSPIDKKKSIILNSFKLNLNGKTYCVTQNEIHLSKKRKVIIYQEKRLLSEIIGLKLNNESPFFIQFKNQVLGKFIGICKREAWDEYIFEITINKKKFIVGFENPRNKIIIQHYDFY